MDIKKFFRRKKDTEKDNEKLKLLVEYINESRRNNIKEDLIMEKLYSIGYDKELIIKAFETTLKGGSNMAKKEIEEDFEEDDEEEFEEQEDDVEEDEKPKVKKVKRKVLKNEEEKTPTISEVLMNHEQRIQALEAKFFRLQNA